MSWVVEQLHRDGSVLSRFAVADDAQARTIRTVSIGRALDNDVILDDAHCAPHHAVLDISADGTARLRDLNTQNGIIAGRNRRAAVHAVHTVESDEPFRLGHTQIRVRSSAWPLAPERALSRAAVWPLALLGLTLVLLRGAWEIWLRDVQDTSQTYIYELTFQAAALCAWSSVYALFGRLISGAERFFSHLLIAAIGLLTGTLILETLETLAFATAWLWPVRITQPVVVIVAAITVRYHLRLADPRHWPALRVAVVLVTALAIIVPLAQHWISRQRLTDVQTLHMLEHPALRIAQPVAMEAFSSAAGELKARVDKARTKDDDDSDNFGFLGNDD